MLKLLLLISLILQINPNSSNSAFFKMVIPADNVEKIEKALESDKNLKGGAVFSSISVMQDKIDLCYKTKKAKKWCVLLLHPSKITGNDKFVGAFALRLKDTKTNIAKATLADLERRLNKLKKEDIWLETRIKEENLPTEIKTKLKQFNDLIVDLLKKNELLLTEKVLKIAKNEFPEFPGFDIQNIRYLAQNGQLKKAKVLLDKLKTKKPNSIELFWEEVGVLVLSQKFQQAVSLVSDKKKSMDIDPCKLENLALFMENNNKKKMALDLRKVARKSFPECLEMQALFARQLLDNGEAEEALKSIEGIVKKHNNHENLLFSYAAILRRLNYPKESSVIYAKLYEMNPKEKYLNLHSTILSQNLSEPQFFAEQKALLKKNPQSVLYKHSVAVLSYYNGEYENSIKLMDELKPILPNNARVHVYAAMSRYELGDWNGSKKWLDELAEIGTTDPDLHYCFAVLFSMKDKERSLKHLQKYLQTPLDPDGRATKRARSLRYRETLEAGNNVYDWIPGVDKPALSPKDMNNLYKGIAALFALLVVLAIAIKMRKKSKTK